MTVQLAVEVLGQEPGDIVTEFEILSEKDIIVVPVQAHVRTAQAAEDAF